jgi:hypothetical protein
MSKETFNSYLLSKGLVSVILAGLSIMVAMLSVAGQTIRLDGIIFTVVSAAVTYYIVLYISLKTNLLDRLYATKNTTLYGAYMVLAVFSAIEIYNIAQSILTRQPYYPSDPSYAGAFWLSRAANLIVSAVSTFIIVLSTSKEFRAL